jgi:hypothetical protein
MVQYTHMHTSIPIYIRSWHTCTCIHTYINIYIHTHIHVYIHAYSHTRQTQAQLESHIQTTPSKQTSSQAALAQELSTLKAANSALRDTLEATLYGSPTDLTVPSATGSSVATVGLPSISEVKDRNANGYVCMCVHVWACVYTHNTYVCKRIHTYIYACIHT